MFKNIKLYQQWKIIFKKSIDDEQRNQLANLDIKNLQDLFQKQNKECFLNQEDIDSFELVKLLQCLGEDEDNMLEIYQTLVKSGIISIDHLKYANNKDFERLRLGKVQQQLIQQEIINYDIQNSEFQQMIDFLSYDNSQPILIQSQLIDMEVNCIESLFKLSMEQIEQIGMNKFLFKTQKDTHDKKLQKNTMSQVKSTQSSLEQNPQHQNSRGINIIQATSILISQPKIDDNKQKIQILQQTHNVQALVKDTEMKNLTKQSKSMGQQNCFNVYQYPLYKIEQLQDVEEYKSMIVIGQTGSGKTTLLNFFLNYYLEVQFTDNFRFILINEQQQTSQAMGQTQSVNIYYVQPFNGKCGIRLIDTPGLDTPGFGYSRIGQDEIIINKIKKCFKEDVESLSVICFLVQSSNARLTPNQNDILSCILSMFGNDIIQNFVFMLTFCDDENPQALEALQFIGQGKICSPVADMIGKIKEPWYLKLNSSAFISPDHNEVIKKYQWEIAMASFEEFYHKKLMKNIPQSLTKLLIRERDQLITIIQNIRPKIESQLNEIQNLKNTHSQIQFLDSKIVDSQNFKIKSQKLVIEIELLKSKSQDVDIQLEELKKLYLDSNSKKTLKQQILDGIEKQIMQQQIECMDLIQNLMTSVNTLKKIALQPGCCEFQEDYVEIMIKEEMYRKREGFLDRKNELMDIKSIWKYIREISNGGIKVTSQFIRDHNPKEENLFQKAKQLYNRFSN